MGRGADGGAREGGDELVNRHMRKNRTTTVVTVVLAGALTVASLGPLVTIREASEWTCAYTGSRRGTTTWLGFMTTSEWYRPSPIEGWLSVKGRPVEHNWVRTAGTSYSAFGPTTRCHRRAPAIYYLTPELQERFLSSRLTKGM